MPNPMKIGSLVVISALSIGAMAVSHPKAEDPSAGAVNLGVLYAAPAEDVQTHIIGSGETLNGVLADAEITGQDLADLMLGLREHLDPRRLSLGAEVTVRKWTDTNAPRSVEVRLNADTTIKLAKYVYGWKSDVTVTPTRIDTVYAAGKIESGRTIYEALVLDENSPLPANERMQLVYNLANIFEFKLDFTRQIQPGDSYRIAYEREARPDNTAREHRILAAEIVNDGQAYEAVYYDNGSNIHDYYDPTGHPLRAGFSRYPVDYPRITSRFAASRYHPILGIYRAHMGNDLGARSGTPVHASANGVVVRAGWNSGGYGNLIEIRHANGYTTRYAHLSRIAKGIRPGRAVSQKELIGYVGMTGLATAPHLHYELRLNGRPIDATKAKLPVGESLGKKALVAFKEVAHERIDLLDRADGTRVAAKPAKDNRAARGGL